MNVTTELRVRSKLTDEAMTERVGKCPGDADYDVLLTGATRVSKLDGRPLCIYLPGILREISEPGVYDVLHDLRKRVSRNRGDASGSRRLRSNQTRTYPRPVASAIAGAVDPGGQQRYCRLTSWTGSNMPSWRLLQPLLVEIAGHLAEHVPDRYHAQQGQVEQVNPAWVVPGTPFTTITVNNSYATGTHTDSGDLEAGFSTIACLRRGTYTGGRLVFPQFRVAVDMGHGDLILMDAHEYHGNTPMRCGCGGGAMNGLCERCGAERISVVAYMRSRLVECGSPAQERAKADAWHEHAEEAARARLARPKD